MVFPPHWHEVPVQQVASELVRLNRGVLPQSFEECCDVAAAVGWSIRIMPVAECPPHSNPIKRIIYVPQSEDRELFQYALHELSEVITGREGGEPEFQASGAIDEHHEVATRIFDHLLPWFEAERQRLGKQRGEEELLVAGLTDQVRQISEEMQSFALAALAGSDLYGRVPPNGLMLIRLQTELQHHNERLKMINARLRCI
jgi:hypothetical protein